MIIFPLTKFFFSWLYSRSSLMVQPWYYGKGQEIRLTIDSQPAKLKCSHQFGKKKKKIKCLFGWLIFCQLILLFSLFLLLFQLIFTLIYSNFSKISGFQTDLKYTNLLCKFVTPDFGKVLCKKLAYYQCFRLKIKNYKVVKFRNNIKISKVWLTNKHLSITSSKFYR